MDQAAFHIKELLILSTVCADLQCGLVRQLIDRLTLGLLLFHPGVFVKGALFGCILRLGFKQIVKVVHGQLLSPFAFAFRFGGWICSSILGLGFSFASASRTAVFSASLCF